MLTTVLARRAMASKGERAILSAVRTPFLPARSRAQNRQLRFLSLENYLSLLPVSDQVAWTEVDL